MTKSSFLRDVFLVVAGSLASLWMVFRPAARPGLELYWLLPVCGTLAIALLTERIRKYKVSIAMYIFIGIIGMKYIMLPICLSLTHGYLHWMLDPGTIHENQYAVFVMLLELIVSVISIRYYLKRENRRIVANTQIDVSHINRITWLLLIALIGICLLRYDRFINDIHFFSLDQKESTGSFEQIALQVIKSYIFVRFLIYSRRKYSENHKIRYVLASMFMGILNCGIFFGINRSLIAQTAIATISVLIYQFPKYRKVVLWMTIPLIAFMILGITLLRHFGIEMGAEVSPEIFDFNTVSTTLESYLCGPYPITSSIDAAIKYRHQLGVTGVVSDFVCNFFPFMLPGLDKIRIQFLDYGNTSILYNSTIGNIGGMFPIIGQMSFYFGPVLAIAFDILAYIWACKILVVSSLKSVRVRSVESKFYYVWLSTLFAFTMCYCLITFLWSWSKFGMLFLIICWINKRISLR